MSEDRNEARRQARAQVDYIVGLYRFHKRLEEWQAGQRLDNPPTYDGVAFRDTAEFQDDHVRDTPLSVEVRTDWHTPGTDAGVGEYRILLCTGGPAVCIEGELGSWDEPCGTPRVMHRGWFQKWEQLVGLDRERIDALTWYVGAFYYGEG